MAQAAENHPQARLLMTQPGVGPNTALAFVPTMGDVARCLHTGQDNYALDNAFALIEGHPPG